MEFYSVLLSFIINSIVSLSVCLARSLDRKCLTDNISLNDSFPDSWTFSVEKAKDSKFECPVVQEGVKRDIVSYKPGLLQTIFQSLTLNKKK